MTHPIDERLADVAGATPEVRLKELWRAYATANATALADPPTHEERAAVQAWLRHLRNSDPFPSYTVNVPRLRSLVSLSMTEKASSIAQAPCNACEIEVTEDRYFPLNILVPIDVEPWSSQSESTRVAIRVAVSVAMQNKGYHVPYLAGSLCVTVVSVIPRARRRMDADNLVKGLLDSLQGVLFANDGQIQCLTSRRIEYSGSQGYYLFAARAVHPWSADVVNDDGVVPLNLSMGRVHTSE